MTFLEVYDRLVLEGVPARRAAELAHDLTKVQSNTPVLPSYPYLKNPWNYEPFKITYTTDPIVKTLMESGPIISLSNDVLGDLTVTTRQKDDLFKGYNDEV